MIVFAAVLVSQAPQLAVWALLFIAAGILMILYPAPGRLPRRWWVLCGVFAVASLGSFLPVSWFGVPQWRSELAELGVNTGSQVAIQTAASAQLLVCFVFTLLTGMWLAGHKLERSQARFTANAVGAGVAVAVLVAWALMEPVKPNAPQWHFGFFPNRNHQANFMAMGAICSLGCSVQAIRDKKYGLAAVMGGALAISLFAVSQWSVSRAGLVLVGVGMLTWLLVMRKHMGRNVVKVLMLLILLVGGLYLHTQSAAKARLGTTVEKINAIDGEGAVAGFEEVDFRVPVWSDALGMIKEAPWTGVGAGQFFFVFPQYRDQTTIAYGREAVHPESDWLWMASEVGVPATLALAALVVSAGIYSFRRLRIGRGRAVRAACLIAAFLVPLHGVFDVPGHRICLVWIAALLYCVSLPAQDETSLKAASRMSRRFWGALGIAMVASGIWLLAGLNSKLPAPAVAVGDLAFQEGMVRVAQDDVLWNEALSKGEVYDPPTEEDFLETVHDQLGEAVRVAPLDQRLYYLRGAIGLRFDDKMEETDRAFAVERKLNPVSVVVPLRQATLLKLTDIQSAKTAWREALRRASMLEERHPELGGVRKTVLSNLKRELNKDIKSGLPYEGVIAELEEQ